MLWRKSKRVRLLQEVPETYRTQLPDALLTALAAGDGEWEGRRRVAIDLEGHGREEMGEEYGRDADGGMVHDDLSGGVAGGVEERRCGKSAAGGEGADEEDTAARGGGTGCCGMCEERKRWRRLRRERRS